MRHGLSLHLTSLTLVGLGVSPSPFFQFQVLVALELEWGLGLNEQQARILRCLSRDYVCIELGDIMNLRTQEGRKEWTMENKVQCLIYKDGKGSPDLIGIHSTP